MKVRAIDLDKEYDRFVLWWAKRNLSAPPKIILRGATGFVVHTGQVDVMAVKTGHHGDTGKTAFRSFGLAYQRKLTAARQVEVGDHRCPRSARIGSSSQSANVRRSSTISALSAKPGRMW